MRAFRSSRAGALVNSALMKKFGWNIGDKLPLHSTIWTQKSDGSLDWTFDIVGTFDAKDPTQASQQSSTVLFHHELFDEGRSFGKGQVGWFEERVDDPAQSAQIADEDRCPVRELAERDEDPAGQGFRAWPSSSSSATSASCCARFSAPCSSRLLFLTGNTMMQSVRERVPELAVLKTLGFSDAQGAGPGDRRVAAALRDSPRSSGSR